MKAQTYFDHYATTERCPTLHELLYGTMERKPYIAPRADTVEFEVCCEVIELSSGSEGMQVPHDGHGRAGGVSASDGRNPNLS